MTLLLELAATTAIVYATYILFHIWSEKARFQKAAAQHGC